MRDFKNDLILAYQIFQLDSPRLYFNTSALFLIFWTKYCPFLFYTATSLKKLQKCQSGLSVKKYIETGMGVLQESHGTNGPHYVCFFVPKNSDRSAKSDKKQLSLHMCVYTIQSKDSFKDGIINHFLNSL